MSKAKQWTLMIPGMALLVLILAAMPLVIKAGDGGSAIQLAWSQGAEAFKGYFAGIGDGATFRFYMGSNQYLFWDRIGYYFKTSLLYVTSGALLGTAIGIFAGLYFAISKRGWIKSIIDFLGSLPDFVFILLMQFGIVWMASKTGVVLFEVATLTSDDPAIALPLIAMIVIPANYMIRSVAMQMRLTLTEDYIRNAKARGLSRTYIVFYHALPNVLPFVKGDLHKLMGIIMGNLFITEYLFNNKGVTMLIFTNAFGDAVYQYNVVVNGLLSFLVLYGIGYGLLRLFIFGLRKVFVR
ncbi:ABC transporter permease subunit [Paenibacillus glycanilyticus]|uniref:ABC transporter permease subunit n=1 Tax=Paenibacillus glycanilyticus TaxID=126569 RepID=UPI00203FE172|nr:ABC transporter permease subunit [Paenibacillus glycanilyticus]MCM3630884.1 ABC transporter permease subunit [Paenibacillus glycanilyticus]